MHAHGHGHGRRPPQIREGEACMHIHGSCAIAVRSVQGYSSSQLRRRPCRRTRACTRPPSTETRQLLCPDHWLNTVKIRPCIYVSFTNNNKKKITTIGHLRSKLRPKGSQQLARPAVYACMVCASWSPNCKANGCCCAYNNGGPHVHA